MKEGTSAVVIERRALQLRGEEGSRARTNHASHMCQNMHDARWIRCSSAAVGCVAATCGPVELRIATCVCRRRARLEERKKTVVDADRDRQRVQGLDDREEWERLRTAAHAKRGVRACTELSRAVQNQSSSRGVVAFCESLSERQEQLTSASSDSHSTIQ